jgi:hypothetical protein
MPSHQKLWTQLMSPVPSLAPQAIKHAVPAALQTSLLLHAIVVPTTQLCDALHVAARVNMLPLHEAAAQLEDWLHWTQPTAASQTSPVVAQSVPSTDQTHLCANVKHEAGEYTVPLHDAVHCAFVLHPQLPFPSQILPPLSSHAVVLGAFTLPQHPPVHVFVTQSVV